MRGTIFVSLVCAALGTTACSTAARPIIAYGAAMGLANESVARSTAKNRAMASLHKQSDLSAVAFTYLKSRRNSALKLSIEHSGLHESNTEFISLGNGWLVKATALVPGDIAARMKKLRTVRGIADITGPDMAANLMRAEFTALRAAVAEAIPACEDQPCSATGRLTIVNFDTRISDSSQNVTVTIDAHVTVEQTGPLSSADAAEVDGLPR